MKKWMKKNKILFGIAVAALLALSVVIFLFFMGFRITYAPEMDNNWNAVSAVATCISAFGAVSAVIAAIIVASKQNQIAGKQASIADQQNRIALFDKRYESYINISRCCKFSRELSNCEDIVESAYGFICIVGNEKTGNFADIESRVNIHLNALIVKLRECEFLYSFDTSQYFMPLLTALSGLLDAKKENEFDSFKSQYQQQIGIIEKEILPLMTKELKKISLHEG